MVTITQLHYIRQSNIRRKGEKKRREKKAENKRKRENKVENKVIKIFIK